MDQGYYTCKIFSLSQTLRTARQIRPLPSHLHPHLSCALYLHAICFSWYILESSSSDTESLTLKTRLWCHISSGSAPHLPCVWSPARLLSFLCVLSTSHITLSYPFCLSPPHAITDDHSGTSVIVHVPSAWHMLIWVGVGWVNQCLWSWLEGWAIISAFVRMQDSASLSTPCCMVTALCGMLIARVRKPSCDTAAFVLSYRTIKHQANICPVFSTRFLCMAVCCHTCTRPRLQWV